MQNPGFFVFVLTVQLAASQEYSVSCAGSYFQEYGFIQLPETTTFDKTHAEDCYWNFTVKHGETIAITFYIYNISYRPDCNRGYVEILDGVKSSSTYILSKTCSPLQTPAYFHSTSNFVSIHIYSSRSKFQPSLLGSIKTVSAATTYQIYPQKKTWLGAREFCEQNYGELASVYPFASEELTQLVENNKEITDAWVGQFVTPWTSLQGCVTQSHEHGMQLQYLNSKYNQKLECSVACSGKKGFLLQGGSCHCLDQDHYSQLNYTVCVMECDIPCPGNREERCGGNNAYTYYQTYDVYTGEDEKFNTDCLAESLTSFSLEARYCSDKLGYTCGFKNGSLMTYYGDDVLSWQAAVSYCERLPGSVGILDLPDWIDHTVWNPLWTAKTRGQHSNFPQVFNLSAGPEKAYIAGTLKEHRGTIMKLKLQDASYEYPFICEYSRSNCGGNLTTNFGTIQSPGYPGSYGYNMLCEWGITVTDSYRVKLEFTNFHLEEHEFCLYDFIKIIGGRDQEEIKFCGNIIPRLHLSEGNNLTIIFNSDNSVSGTGFQASWQAVPLQAEETETEASTSELNGAAIAGIVLGTLLIMVILTLAIFIVYKKRRRTEARPMTVNNQIYGLSSLNDVPIAEGHSYMNVTETTRQPDVVEQCYSTPVRDTVEHRYSTLGRDDALLDGTDDRDAYEYETVAENRLEIDALEYCDKSGSQANLIASDGEDCEDMDLRDAKKEQSDHDTISERDMDDITLASNLTLDDIEKLSQSDKAVVNQEN